MKITFQLFCFLIFLSLASSAQLSAKFGGHNIWHASWVAVPGESTTEYGVYLFRKSFNLSKKPDSFYIRVSADNRYKLYVNEKQVSLGPARGDLEHWNFELIDIAPFLHTGSNILAAEVWNEGKWR